MMVFSLERGVLDLDRRVLATAEGDVRLTTTEARLLAHLASHPERAFGRDELQVEVWGYRSGIPSRTVFTTIGRIRQKIERDASSPRHLLSVEGGYRFVAAASASAAASALPDPATPFVGRAREIEDVLALLRAGARLVSVLGPGGIGKTRFAIECARRLAPETNGAVFVSLETADSAADLIRALMSALSLRPLAPHEDALAGLVERLRERDSLVVCDNLEQVAGAQVVLSRLGSTCPKLRLLITSRLRLSLSGETLLALAPLGEPASGADLEQADAGRLVLDQARRMRPGWEPSAAERQALARLCALAEGSPLALELATAWLRLLEPDEVVRELESSGDLLRTDRADVPARHTSIRAMLASSFRLLAPESARALGALAVVRAPFTREAAREIAGAGLGELGQLVDASMIRRAGGGRFAFHPAVRDEARARLEPQERAGALGRHTTFFLERLTSSYRSHENTSEREWLDATAPDHLDICAAFHRASEQRELSLIARSAEAFYRYLDGRNRFGELAESWSAAKRWIRETTSSPERDRALGLLLALERGSGWATNTDESFLALLEPFGGEDLVVGLIGASIESQVEGRFAEGSALGERAIELARQVGRLWLIGFAVSVCAASYARNGQLDKAAAMLEHAVGLASQRGGRAYCRPLVHLGEVKLFLGQSEAARDLLMRALAACREADDRAFAMLALSRLAEATRNLGDDPLPLLIEAVEEATEHHIPPYWWASALVGLAAHRARAASTAGPALVALAALERALLLPPRDRALVEAARGSAEAVLGAEAALGWRTGAPAVGLEQAALALLADE